jgi:hypothetical protein
VSHALSRALRRDAIWFAKNCTTTGRHRCENEAQPIDVIRTSRAKKIFLNYF